MVKSKKKRTTVEFRHLYVTPTAHHPAGSRAELPADLADYLVGVGTASLVDAPAAPDIAPDPDAPGDGTGDDGNAGDTPASNASKKAWAAYAVSQGMDEEEAAGKSRNELRDLYLDG